MQPKNRYVSMLGVVVSLLCASVAQAQSYHVVNFQAQSGHYVTAEGGGNGLMNANRGAAFSWEFYEIQDENGGDLESGDLIEIRTSGGYYVSQQCSGSNPPIQHQATATSPSQCAAWMVIDKVDNNNNWVSGTINSGDQVAVSGYWGNWQAPNGGGGILKTSGNLGSWEKFFITIW